MESCEMQVMSGMTHEQQLYFQSEYNPQEKRADYSSAVGFLLVWSRCASV
jgi:hypothetical protein